MQLHLLALLGNIMAACIMPGKTMTEFLEVCHCFFSSISFERLCPGNYGGIKKIIIPSKVLRNNRFLVFFLEFCKDLP